LLDRGTRDRGVTTPIADDRPELHGIGEHQRSYRGDTNRTKDPSGLRLPDDFQPDADGQGPAKRRQIHVPGRVVTGHEDRQDAEDDPDHAKVDRRPPEIARRRTRQTPTDGRDYYRTECHEQGVAHHPVADARTAKDETNQMAGRIRAELI